MLIDSSVWLEVFLDGKLSATCRQAIKPESHVPTLAYFEVYKKLKLQFSESKALEAMGALSKYQQADLTHEMGLLAADLSIEHKLGMADSLVLAQAKHLNLSLITLDNDYAGIPGVKILR